MSIVLHFALFLSILFGIGWGSYCPPETSFASCTQTLNTPLQLPSAMSASQTSPLLLDISEVEYGAVLSAFVQNGSSSPAIRVVFSSLLSLNQHVWTDLNDTNAVSIELHRLVAIKGTVPPTFLLTWTAVTSVSESKSVTSVLQYENDELEFIHPELRFENGTAPASTLPAVPIAVSKSSAAIFWVSEELPGHVSYQLFNISSGELVTGVENATVTSLGNSSSDGIRWFHSSQLNDESIVTCFSAAGERSVRCERFAIDGASGERGSLSQPVDLSSNVNAGFPASHRITPMKYGGFSIVILDEEGKLYRNRLSSSMTQFYDTARNVPLPKDSLTVYSLEALLPTPNGGYLIIYIAHDSATNSTQALSRTFDFRERIAGNTVNISEMSNSVGEIVSISGESGSAAQLTLLWESENAVYLNTYCLTPTSEKSIANGSVLLCSFDTYFAPDFLPGSCQFGPIMSEYQQIAGGLVPDGVGNRWEEKTTDGNTEVAMRVSMLNELVAPSIAIVNDVQTSFPNLDMRVFVMEVHVSVNISELWQNTSNRWTAFSYEFEEGYNDTFAGWTLYIRPTGIIELFFRPYNSRHKGFRLVSTMSVLQYFEAETPTRVQIFVYDDQSFPVGLLLNGEKVHLHTKYRVGGTSFHSFEHLARRGSFSFGSSLSLPTNPGCITSPIESLESMVAEYECASVRFEGVRCGSEWVELQMNATELPSDCTNCTGITYMSNHPGMIFGQQISLYISNRTDVPATYHIDFLSLSPTADSDTHTKMRFSDNSSTMYISRGGETEETLHTLKTPEFGHAYRFDFLSSVSVLYIRMYDIHTGESIDSMRDFSDGENFLEGVGGIRVRVEGGSEGEETEIIGGDVQIDINGDGEVDSDGMGGMHVDLDGSNTSSVYISLWSSPPGSTPPSPPFCSSLSPCTPPFECRVLCGTETCVCPSPYHFNASTGTCEIFTKCSDAYPTTGIFYLDTDLDVNTPPVRTFCDNDADKDGGGWAMVFAMDGAQNISQSLSPSGETLYERYFEGGEEIWIKGGGDLQPPLEDGYRGGEGEIRLESHDWRSFMRPGELYEIRQRVWHQNLSLSADDEAGREKEFDVRYLFRYNGYVLQNDVPYEATGNLTDEHTWLLSDRYVISDETGITWDLETGGDVPAGRFWLPFLPGFVGDVYVACPELASVSLSLLSGSGCNATSNHRFGGSGIIGNENDGSDPGMSISPLPFSGDVAYVSQRPDVYGEANTTQSLRYYLRPLERSGAILFPPTYCKGESVPAPAPPSSPYVSPCTECLTLSDVDNTLLMHLESASGVSLSPGTGGEMEVDWWKEVEGGNDFYAVSGGPTKPTWVASDERLGGHPSLRFGADAYMLFNESLASQICSAGVLSMFIVGVSDKQNTGSIATNVLMTVVTETFSNGMLLAIHPIDGRVYLSIQNAQNDATTERVNLGYPFLLSLTLRSSAYSSFNSVQRNGTTLSGIGPAPTPFCNSIPGGGTATVTTLGCRMSGSGPRNLFKGNIASIVMFGGALDTTERTKVEGFLSAKYGGGFVMSSHTYGSETATENLTFC